MLALALVLAGSATASADVKVAFLQGEQVAYRDRPGEDARAAIAALLAGPTRAEKRKLFTTQVPKRVELRALGVEGDTVTIDLSARFAKPSEPEARSARLSQLVLTATKVPGITQVRLLIEGGVPLGLFPGFTTRDPLTQDDVVRPTEPKPETPAPVEQEPAKPKTEELQTRLAALGYLARDAIDGQDGPQTRSAVAAFQKWENLERDGVAGPKTLVALKQAKRPTPRRPGSGLRAEVLLDRQVTLVISGKRVKRVLDVSSGAPGYDTPVGAFEVLRKERNSWSVPYKVWLPYASYFVGGVAFHEYPDVPPYAASHGCVRVPAWDAPWLFDTLQIGTKVTVLASS
jgi:lipoprotein-anchoring transpeptidase ErfK/SrfK